MENMSKTAALAASQNAHGAIWGNGSSWHFTAPHKTSNLHGACVEVNADSYQSAMYKRARYVASTALELIGYSVEDADALTYDQQASAREILAQALKRMPNV